MFSTPAITLQYANFLASLTSNKVHGKERIKRLCDPDGSALAATAWNKTQDWFCSTNRVPTKQNMCGIYDDKTPVFEKRRLFKEIMQSAGVNDQDNFQAVLTPEGRLVHKLIGIDDNIFSIDLSVWKNPEKALDLLDKLHDADSTSPVERKQCLIELQGIAENLPPDAFQVTTNRFRDTTHTLNLPESQGGKVSITFSQISIEHGLINKQLNSSGYETHNYVDARDASQQAFNTFIVNSTVKIQDTPIPSFLNPVRKEAIINMQLDKLNLTVAELKALEMVCNEKTLDVCRNAHHSVGLYVPHGKTITGCHVYRTDTGELQIKLTSLTDIYNSGLRKKDFDAAMQLIQSLQPRYWKCASTLDFEVVLAIMPKDATSKTVEFRHGQYFTTQHS